MDIEVDAPAVSPAVVAGPPTARPSAQRRAQIHHALGEVHRLTIVDALRLSDRSPTELADRTGLGSNLVAFHLAVLEEAGVVARHASEGDARRRYVTLRPDVLAALHGPPAIRADDVVFVCTRNSARSQLAAALWQRRTGRPARSAGHDPAPEVHHLARVVARDHGLDLDAAQPQGFEALGEAVPDLVVSVCDRSREAGIPIPAPTLHWSVPDPVARDLPAFHDAYRQLDDRIAALAAARETAA